MKIVQLGDVARIETGTTPSTKNPNYHGGNIPFVKPGDLDDQPKIISESESYVTDLGAEQGRIIPQNGVMVCCIGSLGKLAIAGRDMITNQQINSVIFNEEKVDPKFGAYFLSTQKKELEHLASSTTVAIVNKTNFSKLEIPLPSLSEQKAIVAKLDRAQRLIDIDKEMLTKYDELIQSVFLEMFGDPVRNEKGFDKGKIRDIVSETKYGTNKKAHETEGEYPVIRMGNLLYNGEWDFSDMKYCDLEEKELPKYLVHKGDVLFNRTNSKELVGKTGVYREEEPMAYAGYLIRVRPNEKATSEYISGYLNCPHGKLVLEHMCKNIVGMANINAQELQDIEILIPPIELQQEYEQKVNEIRSQKYRIKAEIKKSEELFSSLVQGAFG